VGGAKRRARTLASTAIRSDLDTIEQQHYLALHYSFDIFFLTDTTRTRAKKNPKPVAYRYSAKAEKSKKKMSGDQAVK
jgi:hypothetical protein